MQVASVEQNGGGRMTAVNINIRIPEKAIPLIHTPAAQRRCNPYEKERSDMGQKKNRVVIQTWTVPFQYIEIPTDWHT